MVNYLKVFLNHDQYSFKINLYKIQLKTSVKILYKYESYKVFFKFYSNRCFKRLAFPRKFRK